MSDECEGVWGLGREWICNVCDAIMPGHCIFKEPNPDMEPIVRNIKRGFTPEEYQTMAMPESPVKPPYEPGYYWVQPYLEETEELGDPCIAQVFMSQGKKSVAYLNLEKALVNVQKFVWLERIDYRPERLEAELG